MNKTKYIKATLQICKFWQSQEGKTFLKGFFESKLQDGSKYLYERYWAIPQSGILNGVIIDELKTLGLKPSTKIIELQGQGVHNGSKMLRFGEEFDLELREYKGQWRVNRVSEVNGFIRNSQLSNETIDLLHRISIEGVDYGN